MSATLGSPRLQRLARGVGEEPRDSVRERCDLCGEPLPGEHRHLLELSSREVSCACRACALLFDREAASQGRLRLIPTESLRLVDFALDDVAWAELRIPVEMAFFFYSSSERRVMAFYPSPMGPTESLLGLEAWSELEHANPRLAQMQPDVQALLVNHARGARDHYIVPIDECYRLVALIRTRWRGFTGGAEVWQAIGDFFNELDTRSRPRSAREPEHAAAAAERS